MSKNHLHIISMFWFVYTSKGTLEPWHSATWMMKWGCLYIKVAFCSCC